MKMMFIVTSGLLLFLFTSFSFGQKRMVDQEITCVSPEGSVVNGEGLPLRFEMRNLGPDARYKNDTNLYWLHVIEENGDTWLMYQGSLAGQEEGLVELGDTRAYTDDWGIKFIYPERDRPYTINFCVTITTFKVAENGDTIQYFSHYDPNQSNNTCCKTVTILPKTLNIVQGIRQNEDVIWIYPNPVRNTLYIRIAGSYTEREMPIAIYDISGRLVKGQQYAKRSNSDDTWMVNVADISGGIYYIQLQLPNGVIIRKIVVDP